MSESEADFKKPSGEIWWKRLLHEPCYSERDPPSATELWPVSFTTSFSGGSTSGGNCLFILLSLNFSFIEVSDCYLNTWIVKWLLWNDDDDYY